MPPSCNLSQWELLEVAATRLSNCGDAVESAAIVAENAEVAAGSAVLCSQVHLRPL